MCLILLCHYMQIMLWFGWFDPILNLVWHITSNVGDSLNDLIFVIFSLFKRQGLVAQLLRILTQSYTKFTVLNSTLAGYAILDFLTIILIILIISFNIKSRLVSRYFNLLWFNIFRFPNFQCFWCYLVNSLQMSRRAILVTKGFLYEGWRHLLIQLCIFLFSWEKYTTCGSPIPETPFVAFKVPLSEVSHYYKYLLKNCFSLEITKIIRVIRLLK